MAKSVFAEVNMVYNEDCRDECSDCCYYPAIVRLASSAKKIIEADPSWFKEGPKDADYPVVRVEVKKDIPPEEIWGDLGKIVVNTWQYTRSYLSESETIQIQEILVL